MATFKTSFLIGIEGEGILKSNISKLSESCLITYVMMKYFAPEKKL